VLILGNRVVKGASSIDWAFFTRSPVPAGQSGGGVANAIAGTALIVGVAALIGVPIGVGSGMFLAEYGSGRMGFLVRFIADVLNGSPSIVTGIVGWTFLVRPTRHFSALAGAVALAILMIPMLARTTEEMVRLVPNSLREAALALGYARWRTSLKIVARTALGGIVTGCLVGIARVAGETAPLLFTALGNLNFTVNVSQPMQTLSLQIYVYATGPYEDWHRLAPGASVTGEVLLDDIDIYGAGVNPVELRRRIGMVFQRPTPFPTMSIYDNVAAGLRVNGRRPRTEIDDAVSRALQQAALWDEVKDRLHTSALALSGGQQQRLCIARAVAPQPEILLLDEPT